jgi:hypothetical protein
MRKSIHKILFIVVFIACLILGIQLVLFTPTYVATEMSDNDSQVSGLIIQFRDGITEQDSKSVLENYNLTMYKLDYNVYDMDKYYIIVDKDKAGGIKGEFGKEESWTGFTSDFKKGDYYIIPISEQAIHNENFLEILEKHNLQVKKFFWCHVIFTDHSENGISQEDANELKRKLEKNKNIYIVYIESNSGYMYPQ